MSFNDIPARIFLDSSALQIMYSFGEYIYDGGEFGPENNPSSIPFGIKNVEALRQIMLVVGRGNLQMAVSHNSLVEAIDRGNPRYTNWALEMREYWKKSLTFIEERPEAFLLMGALNFGKVSEGRFDYLSEKELSE